MYIFIRVEDRKMEKEVTITVVNLIGFLVFTEKDIKNEKRAINLFKLAAEKGHAHSMNNLAYCHENGTSKKFYQ